MRAMLHACCPGDSPHYVASPPHPGSPCNYLSDYSSLPGWMRKSSIVISAFIHTPPRLPAVSLSPPPLPPLCLLLYGATSKVSNGVVGNGTVGGAATDRVSERTTPIRLFHREKATASRSTSHFFPDDDNDDDDTCSFPGN